MHAVCWTEGARRCGGPEQSNGLVLFFFAAPPDGCKCMIELEIQASCMAALTDEEGLRGCVSLPASLPAWQ